MAVRVWKKVTPLNITDVLVTYEEDGVPRNLIITDAQLASKCWSVQSQQAVAQKRLVDAQSAAQEIRNDTLGAIEEAYQASLAAAQQKFAAAVDTAEKARVKAMKPIQQQVDLVAAEAFKAAHAILPPAEDAPVDPGIGLTPS